MREVVRRALAVVVAITLVVGAAPAAVVELGGPGSELVGLVVADHEAGKFNFTGDSFGIGTQPGGPSGLYQDKEGHWYIPDSNNNHVEEYYENWTHRTTHPVSDGPKGLDRNESGYWFVAGDTTVRVFTEDWSFVRAVNVESEIGTNPGDVIQDLYKAPAADGKVYVLDSGIDSGDTPDLHVYHANLTYTGTTHTGVGSELSTQIFRNGTDGNYFLTRPADDPNDRVEEWYPNWTDTGIDHAIEGDNPGGIFKNRTTGHWYVMDGGDRLVREYSGQPAGGAGNAVSGTVSYAGNDTAIEGASITVNDSAASDITDASGAYSITLDNGDHEITASFGGSTNSTAVSVSGSDITGVDMTLTFSSTVSGYVVDNNGDAIASASVNVTNTTAGTVVNGALETNASGGYSITLDNGNDYNLTAYADGYNNKTETVSSLSSDTALNITLLAPAGSSSDDPPPGTYLQTFVLESSSPVINPQNSELTAFYWTDEGDLGDEETGDRCSVDEGDQLCDVGGQEDTTEFDFQNHGEVRLYDAVIYDLAVSDTANGGYWQSVGFVANKDGGEGGSWNDDGTYTLLVEGPGGDGTTVDEDDGDVEGGSQNDDGAWTAPPPIEQPEFEIPELDTYLQTGIFFIDGERCIGLRYYDPNQETTELSYDFAVNGTEYEDTITFDEPVGYFRTCIDEASVGPSFEVPESPPEGNVSFDFTQDGTAFNASFPFGEGGAAFDFGNGSGESGFGFGGGLPPVEPGGGGNPLTNPWLIALLGAVGLYYFRKPRRRQQLASAAQAGGRQVQRVVGRLRP